MRSKRIIYIFFTILCMIVIFAFSSKNSTTSNNTSKSLINKIIIVYEKAFNKEVDNELIIAKLNYPIRKLAHYSIYFLLGILVYNVIFYTSSKYKGAIALLICFLYALFDEIHQLYVSGRTGQFKDTLIDTLGALTAILLFSYLYSKTLKNKNNYKLEN